jgi:hypothetical protein
VRWVEVGAFDFPLLFLHWKELTGRREIKNSVRSTGGRVQVTENLLCKHEALSSNPAPPKKKKNSLRAGTFQ